MPITPIYMDTNNLKIVPARRENSTHAATLSGKEIQISGISREHQTKSLIVLLDSTSRFVTGTRVQADGMWKLYFNSDHIAKDRGALGVQLYVVKEGGNMMAAVHMPDRVRHEVNRYIASLLPDEAEDVPSFRDRYIDLIVEATKQKYVATSIHNQIRTGNNYQSTDLGGIFRQGARSLRCSLLERIDFNNASVLDLGCNTGEVSRDIRQLGARLVDGYEYDPFFVETGRAMNAALGTTRVSLFQGDVTNRKLYEAMQYDIVVALSVYVYIISRIPDIAKIADILVFETHTLDHGLDFYLHNLLPHFPFAKHLGYSENDKDPRKSRAFLVFSTSKFKLQNRVPDRQLLVVKPYFRNLFIEEYGPMSPTELPRFCRDLKLDASKSYFRRNKPLSFGTTEYFFWLLVGYADYIGADRTVQPENTFLKRYRHAIESGTIDSSLVPLLQDEGALTTKVRNKFVDIELFAKGLPELVPPIYLKLANRGRLEFLNTRGKRLRCLAIDGHHRLFLAQLLGYTTLPYTTRYSGGDKKNWRKIIKSNYSLQR